MTGDRRDAHADLIEKTAALLAADYPFTILVEQLCSALASSMHATVRVAVRNDGDSVRLYSLADDGRAESSDQLLPEGSPLADVFHSGRVRIVRPGLDANDDAAGQVYVPIVYGKQVLGVVSVTRAVEFARDEVRSVESMARHLAIAIRNERLARAAVRRIRYPWAAVFAVAAVVIVTTVGTVFWTHTTLETQQIAISGTQHAAARRVAEVVENTLDDDRKVAAIAAALANTRPHTSLDALGAEIAGSRATAAVERIVIARGSATTGAAVFVGPSYSGATLPFRGGTATAELRTSSLAHRMGSILPPGSQAQIVDGTRTLLTTGLLGIAQAAVLDVPLRVAPLTVRFVTSQERARAQSGRVVALGAAFLAVVWLVGGAAFLFLHLMYISRRDAARLREQRVELQNEIVSRLDVEEQLRSAAFHDALTGLPNRAFFLSQLRDVVEQRESGQAEIEYAVLFVDLDRFYVVNDSLGHSAGDQLLAAIAYRLEETIPPHALIARLGGDEFVLLLPAHTSAVQEAIAIAEDILEALRNPFRMGEREVYSGASIGILKVDESHTDPESILRDADISMYQAKRKGRAGYAVFDQAMRHKMNQQLELEASLRGAVDRGEILAFYQPIVSVRDERIVGFEALARWHRLGETETVAAGDFVPVAEITGMMRAIDAELFAQVCRDVAELSSIAPGVRVSVNISANDLTRASLLADIDSTMQRFSVSPHALRIEITETAVMEDAERALAMLAELRARGLEMVVDDFGAGYSSLSYLQRLPLAGVKIDRSFIGSLPGDPQALEIVRAIVALAKTLGLHVTAEGVERPEQYELLRLLGVEYAQGYWFSPPVDFASAKAFFAVRS